MQFVDMQSGAIAIVVLKGLTGHCREAPRGPQQRSCVGPTRGILFFSWQTFAVHDNDRMVSLDQSTGGGGGTQGPLPVFPTYSLYGKTF